MQLMINGQQQSFASALTVAQLIEQLGHSGRRIAVERNGDIVPRSQHAETQLQEGDKLEIVVAVGGG